MARTFEQCAGGPVRAIGGCTRRITVIARLACQISDAGLEGLSPSSVVRMVS